MNIYQSDTDVILYLCKLSKAYAYVYVKPMNPYYQIYRMPFVFFSVCLTRMNTEMQRNEKHKVPMRCYWIISVDNIKEIETWFLCFVYQLLLWWFVCQCALVSHYKIGWTSFFSNCETRLNYFFVVDSI